MKILLMLLIVMIIFPTSALAQDSYDPTDPNNIGIPISSEFPSDFEKFPDYGIPEDQSSYNIRLSIFKSTNPNQVPLFIRYCPTQNPVCSPGLNGNPPKLNEIVGLWYVGEIRYVNYSLCRYNGKWKWCVVEGYDTDKTDRYIAGYIAVSRADGTLASISPVG